MEPPAAYRLVRQRVDGLLRPLSEQDALLPVPACPAWTVHDVLAHLVGICADVLSGNVADAGEPAWTAAQVAAGRGRTVEALLDAWATDVEAVVARLTGRSVFGQTVMDAVSHEYDLRGALDVPADPDDPVPVVGLAWLARAYGRLLDAAGAPTLELHTDAGTWRCGSGPVAATVTATPVDLLRSLTGRRTHDEVRALDWDGDPGPWLPLLTWGPFEPPG